MMRRVSLVIVLFLLLLGVPTLAGSGPGSSDQGGAPSYLASRDLLPGAAKGGQTLGLPLPDQEIDLRGTGLGVYPIEVRPGVIYDETGPVKLWDEVSTESGAEPGVPPRPESEKNH